MFIKAKMFRDKRKQNSELFLRQTHEVSGCIQLRVINPKLGLSTAVKIQCLECASMTHFLFIPQKLKLTVEHKVSVHRRRSPLSLGLRRYVE
jgi:hypothetical protein